MQHLKPKYNIVIHCVTFIEKQVTYNVQNMEIFVVAEIQSTRIKNIKNPTCISTTLISIN